VAYLLIEESFQASDDVGRATALGCDLLSPCHVAGMPASAEGSPTPFFLRGTTCHQLAAHCYLPGHRSVSWRRRGTARAARIQEVQEQLQESVRLCASGFQCLGLYGVYGCVIA